MENTIIKTNDVILTGVIASKFTFNHEVRGEKFYSLQIGVERLSGHKDYIVLCVSEKLIDTTKDHCGEYVHVTGQFRSYNRHIDGKSKLELSVWVKTIEFIDYDSSYDDTCNRIALDGYICKPPVHRITPASNRDIADIMLACNRAFDRTDYIPCIAWGRNAHFVSSLDVGAHIKLLGRIQSREYVKKISETEEEVRVAWEVSIENLELVDTHNCQCN